MKIVYVYPQFTDPAGTERVLIDKMNYFAEREGYEVFMLTNQQGNHSVVFPISEKVKRKDLDIRFWELYKTNFINRIIKRKKYKELYSKSFLSFVEETKPDIVIASTFHFYIIETVANCPFPFIRILESHIDKRYLFEGHLDNRKDIFKRLHLLYERLQLKHIVPKYNILVTLNKEDSADWSRCIKTKVISNAVHLNPTGNYCDYYSKKIIFVGRYVKQKGIPDLYEIWRIVYMKHPEWSLEMYGSGDINTIISLDDMAKINIHVHQAEKDIFKCYLDSSFLVLTSLYEPFGLVMPEAMSCGLPVVAFDCPSGPSEIITDGVDGFLIKDRNRCQFAEKVCLLIESLELRKKMGQAAIISSKHYSENLIMPEWEKLFVDLMISSR